MAHPSKLIKELGISPLKKLGQNFQVDTHVIENAAGRIPAGARVLEIGPGLGAWTDVFLARGHEMVLVEKDRTLAQRLIDLHAGKKGVQVFSGDFLEFNVQEPPFRSCSAAVGNLPFYVTSELLLTLIVDCPFITHGLFGVQLEVAERLVSAQGSSLAIALGSQGKIEMAGKISRTSFYPSPNVDAALIAFRRTAGIARPHLRLLLKAAFWGKRKALGTALRKNPFFRESELGPQWTQKLENIPAGLAHLTALRADDLTIADFCALYDFLNT